MPLAGELLDIMRDRIVPSLASSSSYKGSHGGKIAIVGGSSAYSGAPFFAARAAARAGADLVHVYTEKSCANAIKSRSGDLVVLAMWEETDGVGAASARARKEATERCGRALVDFRIDSVLIGPGLGAKDVLDVHEIVPSPMRSPMSCVIDADGLRTLTPGVRTLSSTPWLRPLATPNKMELWRLLQKGEHTTMAPLLFSGGVHTMDLSLKEHRDRVSNLLSTMYPDINFLVKGEVDHLFMSFDRGCFEKHHELSSYDVFDERDSWETDSSEHETKLCVRLPYSGAPKRCGGQGDILAGILAVFLAWARKRLKDDTVHLEPVELIYEYVAAVAASCYLVKASAAAAYERHGRGAQAEDILSHISTEFRRRLEPDPVFTRDLRYQ